MNDNLDLINYCRRSFAIIDPENDYLYKPISRSEPEPNLQYQINADSLELLCRAMQYDADIFNSEISEASSLLHSQSWVEGIENDEQHKSYPVSFVGNVRNDAISALSRVRKERENKISQALEEIQFSPQESTTLNQTPDVIDTELCLVTLIPEMNKVQKNFLEYSNLQIPKKDQSTSYDNATSHIEITIWVYDTEISKNEYENFSFSVMDSLTFREVAGLSVWLYSNRYPDFFAEDTKEEDIELYLYDKDEDKLFSEFGIRDRSRKIKQYANRKSNKLKLVLVSKQFDLSDHFVFKLDRCETQASNISDFMTMSFVTNISDNLVFDANDKLNHSRTNTQILETVDECCFKGFQVIQKLEKINVRLEIAGMSVKIYKENKNIKKFHDMVFF